MALIAPDLLFSAPSPAKMSASLTSLSVEREPRDSNVRKRRGWQTVAIAAVAVAAIFLAVSRSYSCTEVSTFALNHTRHTSETGAMKMRNLKTCRTNSSMDENGGT